MLICISLLLGMQSIEGNAKIFSAVFCKFKNRHGGKDNKILKIDFCFLKKKSSKVSS
jgi:hypothetical protein